jgi:hypothetical protein
VTLIGEKRNVYKVLVGSQKERGYWDDTDVGRRKILKWVLEKEYGVLWIGYIWLSVGTNVNLWVP